jgi:hypothetical protein
MGFRARVAYKYDVKINGFSGLMYAVLYDHFDIINLLLDELLVKMPNCVIPVSFSTNHVMTSLESSKFHPLNITSILVLPKNTTVLELCLHLNKLKLFNSLMQHVYKLPIT